MTGLLDFLDQLLDCRSEFIREGGFPAMRNVSNVPALSRMNSLPQFQGSRQRLIASANKTIRL
jgi:hypothetical protein